MVRVSHHHTIHVSQFLVGTAGTIQRERGRPHGRPEVVALHAEQKFKHQSVHVGIDPAKMGHCPVSEAGPLIIDKEASEANAGFLGNGLHLLSQNRCGTLCRGGISEVYQRGDPKVLGQCKHTVDRTTLVAAHDHQQFTHKGDLVDLPLSPDLLCGKSAFFFQLLCQRALAQGSAEDGTAARVFREDLRSHTGHQLHIAGHRRCNSSDTLESLRLHQQR